MSGEVWPDVKIDLSIFGNLKQNKLPNSMQILPNKV